MLFLREMATRPEPPGSWTGTVVQTRWESVFISVAWLRGGVVYVGDGGLWVYCTGGEVILYMKGQDAF